MTARAAPSDQALASAPDGALKPTACIVLANGQVFYGRGFGAAGRRGGRALLQHRHDRLPGDHDRSLLCRADRHLHLPAHRQRRGERRGRRDRRPGRRRHGGEVGPDRAVELARRRHALGLAGAARAHRRRRRRHPAADPRHPAAGRAARGDQPFARRGLRPRRPARPGARLPGPRRHGPRPRRHLRPELPLGRDALGLARGLRAPRGAGPAGGRDRLRRQAQHPALPRQRRLRRDGAAGDGDGRGGAGARARRGCSCRTAPATRRRPAPMPCR